MIAYENLKQGYFYLFHMFAIRIKGRIFKWQERGQLIKKEEDFCIIRLIPSGVLERVDKYEIDKIFKLESYEV